jgi:hypothetical protein
MWRQAEELMKSFSVATVCILLVVVVAPALFAQDARTVELPNPMTIHTWFIIGIAGAFLAWCISFAIQLQKEASTRKSERGDLRKEKEELLNKLTQLETQKESGQINEQRYKHEHRELRFKLAKVLEQLANPEGQKSAKKTS